MTVVSNSTALVHLSAVGRLDLLRELFGEVYIPEEVYQEVVVHGAGKPGAAEVQAADRIKTQAVTNKLAFAVRLQAQTQGLKITGTVGILLMADEQGRLNFQQALDDLLATGFRLSPAEYQRVINLWKAKKGTTP